MVPAHSKSKTGKNGSGCCTEICRIKLAWEPSTQARLEPETQADFIIFSFYSEWPWISHLVLWSSMNGVCHTKLSAQFQAHGSNNCHLYYTVFLGVTGLSFTKSVIELWIQPRGTTNSEPSRSLVFPLWPPNRKERLFCRECVGLQDRIWVHSFFSPCEHTLANDKWRHSIFVSLSELMRKEMLLQRSFNSDWKLGLNIISTGINPLIKYPEGCNIPQLHLLPNEF